MLGPESQNKKCDEASMMKREENYMRMTDGMRAFDVDHGYCFFSFRVGRRVPPVHLFFDLDEKPTVMDRAAIHVHEPNEAVAWA